jgi:PleD family two-component response regulator
MTRIDLSTGLFTKEDFERQLALELRVALVQEAPLAVVAVVPQHLPGEGVAEIVRVAANCVRELVRDEDVAGHLDDDVLAVGLLNCDRATADVLAFRLQSDLRMRSHHLRNTNWEIGVACLPEDGSTAEELVAAAVDAARNRRKRIASEARPFAINIPPALGEFR